MGNKPKNNSKDSSRDRCQTPAYAVDLLRPFLDQFQRRLGRQLVIWESAAGEGYLVAALEACGYQVIATDILGGADRFSFQPEQYDIEVTNVPFSVKYRWLRHAAAQHHPFALLMPSDSLFAGKEAQPVIEHQDVKIICPNVRIDFKMPNTGWGLSEGDKHTAQMHTSWFTRGLGVPERITFADLRQAKRRWVAQMKQQLAEDAGQMPLFDVPERMV